MAYALAGTVDIDLNNEPLGTDKNNQPVYLKDLWPSQQEISETIASSVKAEMFKDKYADVFSGSDMWKEIKVTGGDLYEWDENSTYIHHPPYFQNISLDVGSVTGYQIGARAGHVRRLDHHRSHLTCGQYRHGQPGWEVSAGT